MKGSHRWLAALVLATLMGAARADCDAPHEPGSLPDGDTATKEEMIEGQERIREYMKKAQAYVDCVDAEEERAMAKLMEMEPDARDRRVKDLNDKRHARNMVVEQMHSIADRFNTELEKFQARQ